MVAGATGAAYARVLRPALFRSYGGDPERVHTATLAVLAALDRNPAALAALRLLTRGPRRPVEAFGLTFPGVVGLAAGMDKDGVAPHAWAALGFGHVELGTVTATAQPGNPRPRLFRLPASGGLVNRMGFNNAGAAALAARLDTAGVRRGSPAPGVPVGISLGKTKTTPLEDAAADYLASFAAVAPHADYVAVNVSSPNTPGLRSLQDAATLRALVEALVGAARAQDPDRPVPVLVKVAPDLTFDALEDVLDVCTGAGAAGLVATNTTLAREGLAAPDAWRAGEAGGLSGAPLTARARAVVGFLASRTDLPVVGVGGIVTADDGQALLDAGARLLQVYTGFVYAGPALLRAVDARAASAPVAREGSRA
ncbi:quinone-dependent dihydroorotate dehydrogenase [Microlunatus flavus]|uniref:Dihydroorotate dehydrogenase (quinone) n=1 Tax=Microlunatus flavus TaxID=1036181 RepID=A0A1H9FH52_9ACTN|nr:quinone-dependent dihydroorotate dehydrogenase [Microlunatus flavus]SEQ37301.1 dihydroorotate dehydrogenase [Microlunatus flavus]